MGKGNRNRELRFQDKLENPQKYQKKKQLPKWLMPAVSLVLVVAMVVGVLAYALIANGAIKRSRILVKSTTKFDVNQQMATFIAWNNEYNTAYYYYSYMEMGYITDTYGITTTFSSAEDYAVTVAQSAIMTQLRDSVDNVVDQIIDYVAVSDAAYKAGVRLDPADEEAIEETIENMKDMAMQYGYSTFGAFLKAAMGSGVKEKDIRNSLKLVAMYNKYCTQVQGEYQKALTVADIEAYVKANAGSFYKTDFLTYKTEHKHLAEDLATATSALDFKNKIANHYFDENYKIAYNYFTVRVEADAALDKIAGKTDTENGNAMTDALTQIGAVKKTYTSTDEDLNKDIKAWLFDTRRERFNTVLIGTDDAFYVLEFDSRVQNADESITATVHEKKFDMVDGTSHEGDADFKANIWKKLQIRNELLNEEDFEVPYKDVSDVAKELETALKAMDEAGKKAKMEELGATYKTGVASNNSVVPDAILDKVFESTSVVGTIAVVEDEKTGTTYLVYLAGKEGIKANVYYVEPKADVFYQVFNMMNKELVSTLPVTQSEKYTATPGAGTYQEWLFSGIGADCVSIRKENDTTWIEGKEKESNEENAAEKTVYNAYIVLDKTMYLDTSFVIDGGYLLYTGTDFEKNANTGLQALNGKTGTDLTAALAELNSNATISSSMTTTSVTNDALRNWLFDEARVENEYALVRLPNNAGMYLAVYLGKTEAWKQQAENGCLSDKLSAFVEDLAKNYTVNERVLKKIGEPTPVETDNTTTVAQ